MEVYRTEAEQIQALKQWWNENGKAIIAGVVIGFAALFGWRGWQANLTTESLAASDIYQQMIGSARADQPETAQTHANTLLAEYKSTAYAHYAALLLAKYAAENTDYASAGEQLRRVMDTASQEQIRHIARLRLARVLLADNKFTDAQALLDGTDQGQFTPLYQELQGDIHIRQGNRDAARRAYLGVQSSAAGPQQADPILDIKLEDLGQE